MIKGSSQELKHLYSILEKVFIGYKNLPDDVAVFSIGKNENNRIVSVLFTTSVQTSEIFNNEPENLTIDVNPSWSKNLSGIGDDLNIRFDIYSVSDDKNAMYVGVAPGEMPSEQFELINALKSVDKLNVFVVDENREIISLMNCSWDYSDFKEIIG